MDLITLVLAGASVLISALTFINYRGFRARLISISSLLGGSVVSVRKGVERIDLAVKSVTPDTTNPSEDLMEIIRSVRNDLERRIRRIILFSGDESQCQGTLQWFWENGIPEDAVFVRLALKSKCISGRRNRQDAKALLRSMEKDSKG